ncbi:hypothetical protein [Actinomadura madurae]|uniref:hypothetical protein n=1 Tax=Actinomadura madurae TaxID=1993 RepID=UPI0020D24C60|nr:hypothetical protein [Actinomadura madurae]MCP9947195.1 hypothetical protein [Actinomadura madurae]MCP9963961.1 hypothetical protein [Actinomadura madurae]MCP9976435.1 hypothetical protein [Actinomadura madurae]MCQ0012072.1 hypothetical protein [Actinomadura madurae]MCQ0012628.1 hypothetical protein [Actinomadura madurae]
MITRLGRVRIRPGCPDPVAGELRDLRHRVARLRREVQALQARADALYGADEAWSDPEAVAR